MLPFGQTLLLWRAARGLTQAQLAVKARVPRPNLSAIERGTRDVSLRTVRALAAVLEINPGALVDGQSPQPPPTLSFDREQLDRIARAVVRGEALGHPEEQALVESLRDIARPRLEASGIVLPRTRRGRLQRSRQSLSLRQHLSPSVFRSLLDRISDESSRHIHESQAD